MASTFELALDMDRSTSLPDKDVKGYLFQKLLTGHTDTHRTDCSSWTTKVVGEGSIDPK